MIGLPHSPGSTLVLRRNQETVHDFILQFLPPCGPHLTRLATGSLERSLLVFSTPGGLTGNDLSHLFFTCSNTNQAATCTCNTQPRISPHYVVYHSSHQEATIHRSSNHIWSSISPLMSALTTHTYSNLREKKKKRNKEKETSTSDRKPNKGKEQDQLKKTSLGPLRQGHRLDTSETKLCSSKERKPPNKNSKTTKSSPCTHASSP
jgi:hypothetical protein